MFNNRRSEIEIIHDILDLSKNGAKKTELLYQVNLSYFQLNSYLENLLGHDMLKEEEIPVNGNGLGIMFVTTDKGHSALSDISKTLSHFAPKKPF